MRRGTYGAHRNSHRPTLMCDAIAPGIGMALVGTQRGGHRMLITAIGEPSPTNPEIEHWCNLSW